MLSNTAAPFVMLFLCNQQLTSIYYFYTTFVTYTAIPLCIMYGTISFKLNVNYTANFISVLSIHVDRPVDNTCDIVKYFSKVLVHVAI